MAQWRPDPSFYTSPGEAAKAPAEEHAFVALLDPKKERPDALGVVDVKKGSPRFGKVIARVDMPEVGDELHHFGWNACSSHLCAYAPHAHVERRYLVVPGANSSRVHIVDAKNPRNPRIVKVIEPEEVAARTGYANLHTVHCGPDGIYVNALGAPDGDGPGGIMVLDHETFDIKGAWERDRGTQYLAYDFWWHLGQDTMVSSEWGTPNMVKDGVDPELLLAGKYGHRLHLWDLKTRKHVKELDLGSQHQMALELRPAHDPRKAYGFVGTVLSLEDLSANVFLWYLDAEDGEWRTKKVITIPAEPADPDLLPPILKGFGAAAPLVTDINLSLDDSQLYVSCWGTGELRQYDVSDPFEPVLTSSVRIGGMVGRSEHPGRPGEALNGGPQMVEVSRDGKRVYLTNGLYTSWDEQFYPDGIRGWMVKLDADPKGGMALDPDFFVEPDEGMRPHQVRLQGGDASSDSFCYPS